MTNEQHVRTLELFIAKVEELLTCRLLHQKQTISFSLRMKDGSGTAITTTPDEDQLRAFLLVFRNFYAPNEKINFLKICDILEHTIKDVRLKRNIIRVREVYREILNRSPLTLVENSSTISPEILIRRWIYGYYHHTDELKRQEIEVWGFAKGLTKVEFISELLNLSKCIIWTGKVTKQYLKEKVK